MLVLWPVVTGRAKKKEKKKLAKTDFFLSEDE